MAQYSQAGDVGPFVTLVTPAKTKIFRLDPCATAGDLIAVTTVAGAASVGAELCAALNRGARTGDHSDVETLLEALPEAVALSCRQAVGALPEPVAADVPAFQEPRMRYFRPASADVYDFAEAVLDVGLAVRFENRADETGQVDVVGTLSWEDVEVGPSDPKEWWPVPEGWTLQERLQPSSREIEGLLLDPRWWTYRARAYWVWVRDTEGALDDLESWSSDLQWVVEFFDEPVEELPDFLLFSAESDGSVDADDVLTPRTRMVLWMSLQNIFVDLDGKLSDWEGMESMVIEDMPSLVQNQPREWWAQLRGSANRLCEAARAGHVADLEPRTVAEEALIALAMRSDYVDWATDMIESRGLRGIYRSLSHSPEDGYYDEVLPHLTGDTDVEALWVLDSPGPERAFGEMLVESGYAADHWHRLFERVVGELPDPTGR